MKPITREELSRHNSASDCWVAIHGHVYNLTGFLSEHPGGANIILREAGKDGTRSFEAIHSKDILKAHLGAEALVGLLEPGAHPGDAEQSDVMATQKLAVPPLSSVLNLFDFEAVARRVLTPNAWAYYSSGADDELTLRENHSAFHRIWFRPRVLRNVRDVRLETVFLGSPTKLPIYITATALGKLGHPQGEVALTRAAGTRGIVQMMPTLASCSLDEMMDAAVPGQSQWFQLYVNPNRELTRKIVQHAEARGCKGLFITVDAPALGHREKDMRTKFEIDAPKVQGSVSERTQGAARAISGFIDPTLDWDDIRWFRSITKMPIALKGIQTAEDALLAHQHGIDAIVLSNHGGRQLDTSRSAIEILVEVMSALEHEGIVGKMEVYVDGGFKRGSDIVKALALGATGVGIGRPFLYAMSGYGQEGVERALDLLKDEMEMVMRMLGARSLKELTRSMVITKDLTTHAGVSIRDNLSEQIYEPLAYTSVDPAKLPASKL